ncbi:Gfo/Idh/MocA family protein [Thalassoglobus polymorphus]|uniref:Putative oxidoreductase n=1 Tax=Thalassoglobus polymorphus TaxID=2527994 RepID=A0A517QNV3_9PLAN|nr:Gfo/Idh/MocA family oxidoreductase [Thalassoglobus polymorphus]QDT33295.1 putative oxidoreductase [Thalassoglobus polymorphus]
MPKKYRVGIIGSTGKGNYGHSVDKAFTKLPNIDIVAVADDNAAGLKAAQGRLKAKSTYTDYNVMLQKEKLDIVAICPRWIDQHHAMLMAAAEAGCHVYMEKPFCPTLKLSDEVVQNLEMRHLSLGIAHVSQYSPVLDVVLKIIRSGEIGEVLEIRGRGKEDHRGGGEDLWVLGSHVFGLMRSLAGGHPVSCTATVTNNGQPITAKDIVQGGEGLGLISGDHVQARYDFENGIVGYFASKRSMAGKPSRFGLQIFGSKGVIEMTSGYLTPAYILRDSSWSPGRTRKTWETITSNGIGKPETRKDGSYEGGHIAAINDLIDSIESQRPTRCTVEDCRDIVEMIAAVYESQRLGKTASMPLETRVNPLSLMS